MHLSTLDGQKKLAAKRRYGKWKFDLTAKGIDMLRETKKEHIKLSEEPIIFID